MFFRREFGIFRNVQAAHCAYVVAVFFGNSHSDDRCMVIFGRVFHTDNRTFADEFTCSAEGVHRITGIRQRQILERKTDRTLSLTVSLVNHEDCKARACRYAGAAAGTFIFIHVRAVGDGLTHRDCVEGARPFAWVAGNLLHALRYRHGAFGKPFLRGVAVCPADFLHRRIAVI